MPAKRKGSSSGDGGGGKKARVDPEPAPRRSTRAPKPKSVFSPSAQPIPPDDPLPGTSKPITLPPSPRNWKKSLPRSHGMFNAGLIESSAAIIHLAAGVIAAASHRRVPWSV